MESIAVGTKQDLIVDVNDLLENINDLNGTTPRYDVKDKSGVFKMQDQVPTVITNAEGDLMRLKCLIDTTAGGSWASGRYFLYVRFTAAPESPVLGPLEFKVNP